MRSCVSPEGRFLYGIHKPSYCVKNLRSNTTISELGHDSAGEKVDNRRNFPNSDVQVDDADWIFEIHNPFPFKGATFIDKEWADASAADYGRIRIFPKEDVSMSQLLEKEGAEGVFDKLPDPVLLSLATCSTDPDDLIKLAEKSCTFIRNANNRPCGLMYIRDSDGRIRANISNHLLFEAVANNPALPDDYKIAMVIQPGAQGGSEIVGEFIDPEKTHIYEYLRRNSYISGGHYAANMAEDAIRYKIPELSRQDMRGLRHLYYQRTYVRLAEQLKLPLPKESRLLSDEELEQLREKLVEKIAQSSPATTATLWGWNFGFDYAPSRYRLHASHQQVHQQYAMLNETVSAYSGSLYESCGTVPAYGCGDLIADTIEQYKDTHNRDFFSDYRSAIGSNKRMDERDDLGDSLIIWQDDKVLLFVPKAQTSQWEIQLMTKPDPSGYLVGNIIEADSQIRESLDKGILKAQQALAGLGAKMVTSIEYPKRIGEKGCEGQPLIYCFLPRLPESPGAFSEAQLRFINGHYPEDFAAVCKKQL